MSQSSLNSKHPNTNDTSIEYLSKQLQNNNKDAVLHLFTLIIEQNNALKSSLQQIKHASDEVHHKLSKLEQEEHPSSSSRALLKQIMNINHEMNDNANINIMTNYNNNHRHSISSHNGNETGTPQSSGYNASKCRDSIDITYDTEREHTVHSMNGINDHDLSRIINGIEHSENKTESNCEESSRRTESKESITFTTDEHIFNHHREKSKSMLSQRSREEIITKLESGGRILALIEKSESKGVSKSKMTKFLLKKGVDLDKIERAYNEYYQHNNLCQMEFTSYPLGFNLNKDKTISIQNKTISMAIQDQSIIYEINGKRVDNHCYNKIMHILRSQICPFYIIFRVRNAKNVNGQKNYTLLHEHSMITSVNDSIDDVVPQVSIDWERIGQILLDHRFLCSAKLINCALDHLETFCNDEDLRENGFRSEICKAWSVSDDRGGLLWEILYSVLKYSENERRWFYDLILHFYFKLNDMKTVDIAYLMTKILRGVEGIDVDIVRMKSILAQNCVDGFSFNAEIKSAHDFSALFLMINDNCAIWDKVYSELVEWNADQNLKSNHLKHQEMYKNKYIGQDGGLNDLESSNVNEITIFNDITRISIRNDIDYSNSFERKEWLQYRHNIKNIFIFFAGFNQFSLNKKELKRFLDIFEIKKYWCLPLIQNEEVTMDEFIKYLCNQYINEKAHKIKESISKLTEYKTVLNAMKILDENTIYNELKKNNGILQWIQFQQFAINLSLNNLETEILWKNLHKNGDKNEHIHIDYIFEWLKQKLEQNPHKNTQNINKKKKKRKRKRTKNNHNENENENENDID